MPLWYLMRDTELWAWTFAKSQKVRNLERDPRATLQVEAGSEYAELRGAMLKCDVTVHRDTDVVAAFGLDALRALPPAAKSSGGARRGHAGDGRSPRRPKRVALQFSARSSATWDHRKLAAGVY